MTGPRDESRRSKHKERKGEKLEQQAALVKQLVQTEVSAAVAALETSETTLSAKAQHATAGMLEQLALQLTDPCDTPDATAAGLTPRCVALWRRQASQLSEAAQTASLQTAETRTRQLVASCASERMLTEHKRHTQELLTALQDKQQEQEQLSYDKIEQMKRTVEHLVIQSTQEQEQSPKAVIEPLEIRSQVEATLRQLAINRTSDISLWQHDQKADRTYCEQLFESLASQVAEALDHLEHNKLATVLVSLQQIRSKLCMRPMAPEVKPAREGPTVSAARRCRTQGRAQEMYKPQTARQWMPDRLPDPPQSAQTSSSSKFRPKSCSHKLSAKHLKMAVLPSSPSVL